jgi:hypothetical protein
MFARFVMILLVVALAAPAAFLTSPGHPDQSAGGGTALAAKGKKHTVKKKKPKQQAATVSRAVRGQITQTFLNTETISIPAGAPGTTKGNANPYPATIEVSGFSNGVITDVDLLLLDVSHKVEEDIDILLSKSDSRSAVVMSDVGRIFGVTNLDLTLDDEAAAPLPNTQLSSGVFRPTDIDVPGQELDTFTAPAPTPDGSVALSTFDGTNPNGTWRLFVTDDASGDSGDIAGWALRITAEVDLAIVEQAAPADQKARNQPRNTKRGNHGKKGRK